MIAELGQISLILAFVFALLSATVGHYGLHVGNAPYARLLKSGAFGQFFFLTLAFALLTVLHVQSDFSVVNVVQNSHSTKPMIYKVTGVWGNHEGSMLLWIWIVALFGAAIAFFDKAMPEQLRKRTLAIQALICAAFLSFVILTSNPFERMWPAAMDGQDLNPLLQDPGLIIHPPFLYLGYVGFSVIFSFAVAGLIDNNLGSVWAHHVRPWGLIAWGTLTIGISLGSWWAYYELGWGGWWYWDPVENASFMPWLVGTALIHSIIVVEKRDALKAWTVFLAILTFSLSLIGTFLVRSGIITSVHAFASDPSRGVFILALLVVAIGGSLTLFALRAPHLKSGSSFEPVSREGGIVFNNLVLIVSTVVVLFGTFYPLFVDLITGAKISVGAPFFNMAFVPLMIPVLFLAPIGAIISWRKGDIAKTIGILKWAFALSAICGVVVAALQWRGSAGAGIGIGFAVWLIVGSLVELARRARFPQVGFGDAAKRAFKLPGSAWGMIVGHVGLGILVLGITGVSLWRDETVVAMAEGDSVEVSGYEVTLNQVFRVKGPNWEAERGRFSIARNGEKLFTLTSETRFYTVRGMETTEAGIRTGFGGNFYLTIGNSGRDGLWNVHFYQDPFVVWVWIGSFVLVAGALLSMGDRRRTARKEKVSQSNEGDAQPA